MRSLKSNGGLTRGTGMGEHERLVWLLGLPACAEVNAAMQNTTDVSFATCEQHSQHKDVSKARQQRDHNDTTLIVRYLQERNPFNGEPTLRCVASGRAAESSVNADQAKLLGENILHRMIGKNALEITFNRKHQVVTMATKTAVKINGETIQVDPSLLFQRLVKVAEATPTLLASAFCFELSNIPTSLFDTSGLPRQANKAALAQFIWSTSKQTNSQLPQDVFFVIDGGSLLHQLAWPRGSTYNELAEMYSNFVIRVYGKGIVVFDGYNNGPSTKDMTHLRRTNGCSGGPDICFSGDMLLGDTKQRFLMNSANKQRFIKHLMATFRENGFESVQAPGDADCLIVKTALEKAAKTQTAVVGEDTDLLVLLLFHVNLEHRNVFFTSSSKKSGAKVWDIKVVQDAFGARVCQNILFAHAVGGCDTTSSLFTIGKSLPLRKVQKSQVFQECAQIFTTTRSSREEIIAAGEKALVVLYGGKTDDTLDTLRHVKYIQKLSSCTTTLQPNKLPPTSAAAQFHSLRTYHQVQEWISATEVASFQMDPTDWGWEITGNVMYPVLTDIAAAPEGLLHVIRCNCKTDCQSSRCSCRRHGLVCTVGCGECRGEECMNTVNKMQCLEDGNSSDEEL